MALISFACFLLASLLFFSTSSYALLAGKGIAKADPKAEREGRCRMRYDAIRYLLL